MTQAAKFKASATARGNSGRAYRNTQAYANAQQGTYDRHEAPWDTTTQILTNFAVTRDILDPGDLNDPDHGWSKLTNAEGENDPANFADMLTDIMGDPDLRAAMTRAIKQVDPDFSGTFDEDTLATMANNARNGAQARYNRAVKAGDKTGANAAEKAAGNYSTRVIGHPHHAGPQGRAGLRGAERVPPDQPRPDPRREQRGLARRAPAGHAEVPELAVGRGCQHPDVAPSRPARSIRPARTSTPSPVA